MIRPAEFDRHGKVVLVVEDEPAMVRLLKDNLTYDGYEVLVATDGQAGLAMAAKHKLDLMLLDIMLPKMDGLALCREIRERGLQFPILMLTAKNLERDKVAGLKTGADDYLTKPFGIPELLARAEALLRRSDRQKPGTHSFGDVWVDFHSFEARKRGVTVELSPREFELLRYLIENQGRVVGRKEILQKIWGYESSVYTRTVDTHIANLRQKLEDLPSSPSYIQTVHRIGYRFHKPGGDT
jgi:two-component system alkaline phosphatase synthesis response regulator PhoP